MQNDGKDGVSDSRSIPVKRCNVCNAVLNDGNPQPCTREKTPKSVSYTKKERKNRINSTTGYSV